MKLILSGVKSEELTTGAVIAKRLGELRWTAADLAAKIPSGRGEDKMLTANAVRHWIEDRGAPSRRHAPVVASVLGISLGELMCTAPTGGAFSDRALYVAGLFDRLNADGQRMMMAAIERLVQASGTPAAVTKAPSSRTARPKRLPPPRR